jgi:hypothetical protein
MDLIERYLQAVQFWLPSKQKNDIIAELSEDLHAQIEETERKLGHALTDVEIEAILRQRGRPVLVANRFLPQEHLIGPVLFPIYIFVLKIVTASYLVPWALVWIGMMIYSADKRATFAAHWFAKVGEGWAEVWSTAFLAVGTVTIVFAVLERVQAKEHFLEKWDPRKLPAVRNPALIPRSSSLFEAGATLFCLIWWPTHMYSHVVRLGPVAQISLAPAWTYFFWCILLLTAVSVVVSSINLMRPYWTVQRAIFRLVTDCAGSTLFCLLLKANIVTGIAGPGIPAERAIEFTNGFNLWTERMLLVAIAIGAVVVCADIYRIVRLKTARVHPALQAIAH